MHFSNKHYACIALKGGGGRLRREELIGGARRLLSKDLPSTKQTFPCYFATFNILMMGFM
jgi:hypothetical protein